MASTPHEIPFHTETSNRIIPWLMGVLIYFLLMFVASLYVVRENSDALPTSRLSLSFQAETSQEINTLLKGLETFAEFKDVPFFKQGTLDIREGKVYLNLLNPKIFFLSTPQALKDLENHLLKLGYEREIRVFPSSIYYGFETVASSALLVMIGFFTLAAVMINLLVFQHSLKNHKECIRILLWIGAAPSTIRKLFYKRSSQLILKGTFLAAFLMVFSYYALLQTDFSVYIPHDGNLLHLVELLTCVPLVLSLLILMCMRSLVYVLVEDIF